MYALIKNDIIINIIMADAAFINIIKNQYDACVDISAMKKQPSIGDIYRRGRFMKPKV